jgi:two-component system CheB/CheR fusion protein
MQQRARDIIERQVAHMARLVDDLLDVSRLSRGKMNLQREEIALDDVLDLAFETARPLIDERRHQVTEYRTPQRLVLDGDLARLSQVFANLLNNAAKYTPQGGTISLVVHEADGHVNVSVSDTGIGIDAEHLNGIFELFAQGSSPAPSVGGLGIGLALARRLVELHGGTLTVSSPGIGRGATFTVTLPIVRSVAAPQNSPPRSTTTCSARRVLVVDDNVDAAESTAELLSAFGCQVRTAYDGEQALAESIAFAPDTVLLDLGMPGLDGLETCRRLRTQDRGSEMAIVALTGWGQDEDRRRTKLAGFDAHLVKPLAPDMLLDAIEHITHQS